MASRGYVSLVGLGLVLMFGAPARAGDGPWTLGERDRNVYLGVDYFRYANYRDGDGDSVPLSSGLTAAGVTVVATLGLAPGFEAELKVPYESVRVNRSEDDSICQSPPRKQWCAPSEGIGDVALQLKARIIEERFVNPVSASVFLGVRTGEAYSSERGRLTTLGDGQTDLGGGATVGKAGSLGQGWYRTAVTGAYWYRFANFELKGSKVPADEVSFSITSTLAPWNRFGLGPVLYGFQRLDGVDMSELDPSHQDGWASLKAGQIQVGGELGVYARRGGPTVTFAVLNTIYARNNPADTLVVSMGIGWFTPGRSADLLDEDSWDS